MTPATPAEPSAGDDAPSAGLPLLLSLAMAQFMVVLDFTIVNVALPGPPHPGQPESHHLFRHHAGGIP